MEEQEITIDLLEVVQIVKRHIRQIAKVTVGCLVLACLYLLLIAKPVYESEALLRIRLPKGISSSLNRISDFYIKMAEGLYPVIEIDAGRTIDLVVSKGSVLSVRGEETPVTRKNSTGSRGTEGSEKSKITDNWIK